MGTAKLLTVTGVILASVIMSSGTQHPTLTLSTSCGVVDPSSSLIGCCMCENNRHLWYNSTFPDETEFITDGEYFPYERNTASWGSICSWASELATCMSSKLPQCNADIGDEILRDSKAYPLTGLGLNCPNCVNDLLVFLPFYLSWNRAFQFYKRTCSREQVIPQIQLLLDDPAFDASFQCLEGTTRRNIYRCARSIVEDFVIDSNNFGANVEEYFSSLQRLIEDVLRCMFSMINQSTCSPATRNVLYHIIRLQIPAFIDDSTLQVDQSTTEDFSSSLRCSVGVFGDPHLRTCWAESLVTCSAPGEQTYISNKYFTIKGVNREVGRVIVGSPRATSLQSVLVTFNSFDGSRVVGTYDVTDGNLPKVFSNVNSNVAGTGQDSVVLHDDPYNRVRFVQASTGTVMVIRQWGGNYFFTVRVAESLVLSSSGLLPDGCPDDQVITLTQFLPAIRKRSVSHSECSSACQAALNNTAFEEKCVLDCVATENLDFATNMSMGALDDESLVVIYDTVLRQGTSVKGGGESVVSLTHILPVSVPLLAAIFLYLVV